MKKTKMLFGLIILLLLMPLNVPSFAQPILKVGSSGYEEMLVR